ncbi:hypothetical protein [Reyranella sp.]|uniref:hypothetical protein n=1 Tax=Reyranella sp. TaxID=1929291 RepID=UPI003782DB6C
MKPAFREDPYPFYERFRGANPLLRVADTIWFALGHAEVAAMLRRPLLSTDEQQHATTEAGNSSDPNRARSLLFADPPGHTRLRGLVAHAFTPRRIKDRRRRCRWRQHHGAYPVFTGASFAVITLAASFAFHERLLPTHLLGIGLVVTGIVLVTR